MNEIEMFLIHIYNFHTFILIVGLRLKVDGEAYCKWREYRSINKLYYDIKIDEIS